MNAWKRLIATALGLGSVTAATAGDEIRPVGLFRRAAPPACPPAVVCPPAIPGAPGNPLVFPSTPGTPGTPGTPDSAAPGAERQGLAGGSNLLAEAPARGTNSPGSFFPTINGDLLGGGGIAGPLPVRFGANGQVIGATPIVVLPNGQRVALVASPTGTRAVPVDELLLARSQNNQALGSNQNSSVQALFPPDGTVFDRSLANLVARYPSVVRGAFKVTENESPRPTTRFYVSYYYYDQVFNSISGPDVPRTQVHQEIIGYEQAFLDNKVSLSVRIPYNQLRSDNFFSQTGIGDLSFVAKVAVYEDRSIGDLISTGIVVTAPTGDRPYANTLTGDTIRGWYLQPFVGYVIGNGDWFLQGLSSLVVPTDDRDAMLLANSAQIVYYAYRNPGGILSAWMPTIECHLNTPLTHRGSKNEPVGFPDSFTALAGSQFVIKDRSALGFAVGAPLTGPRPFSLQLSAQFNLFF